jgi:hypothetical protein
MGQYDGFSVSVTNNDLLVRNNEIITKQITAASAITLLSGRLLKYADAGVKATASLVFGFDAAALGDTIPAGTLCTDAAGVYFATDQVFIAEASDTAATIPATAVVAGTASNVLINTIDTVVAGEAPDFAALNLTVINSAAAATGGTDPVSNEYLAWSGAGGDTAEDVVAIVLNDLVETAAGDFNMDAVVSGSVNRASVDLTTNIGTVEVQAIVKQLENLGIYLVGVA